MKSKYISAFLILLIISGMSVYTVFNAFLNTPKNVFSYKSKNEIFETIENIFKDNIPFNKQLKKNAVLLKYMAGEKKQNNVYISNDTLFKIMPEPEYELVYKNTESIIKFAENYRIKTFAMLIPSSSAIKQQEIEDLYRHNLVNEKILIEDIYSDFSSHVSSVNVYPVLFSNNDKNIYYRTDSNLTSLGGYYVYEQLTKRMNLPCHKLNRYEIKHEDLEFYGDIYDISPYKNIPPDSVSTYNFIKYNREYRVSRTLNGETNTFYELYPREVLSTGKIYDLFLGGEAEKITIDIGSQNKNKLLIYGDKSVMSYLPFLAVNYGQITFINTDLASEELCGEIDVKGFDEVLFSYSTDSFSHKNCFKALNIK